MSDIPSLFDDDPAARLARTSDPSTSHDAAKSLDHRLTEDHKLILALYGDQGLTDGEVANIAVLAGYAMRHETARRMVRTLREEHDLLEPFIDPETGEQAMRANHPSNRQARVWQVKR